MHVAAVNWGDLPTWVSASAALLALSFAAVAALIARKTYLIESERDRIAESDRKARDQQQRRDQAARISAWWGRDPEFQSGAGSSAWGAIVLNSSEAPVYQVFCTILSRDGTVPPKKLSLPVLPPSQTPRFLPVAAAPIHSGTDVPPWDASDLRVQLSFTDASGVRWRRDKYGRLFDLEPKLDIWVHDRFDRVMSPFSEDFRAAYGVEVAFRSNSFDAHRTLLLESSEGIDGGVFSAPHDWCGELVASGKVESLTLTDHERAMFDPDLLELLTHDGRLYGIPAALDTTVLYTNTDLVARPPDTIEDLVAVGKQLQAAGRTRAAAALQVGYDGDPFHLSPLFTSAGGWLFGRREDGGWDPGNVGVDAAESIAAYERIASLGERGAGLLRRSVDEAGAFELFLTGRSPFLLSSTWVPAKARAAGVAFVATPVPPFAAGGTPRPFVSLNAMFVSQRGRTKLIGHDFVPDYLSRVEVMEALMAGLDAPVALADLPPRDPIVAMLHTECHVTGAMMPTFPQMRTVWRVLGKAEAAIIAGEPVDQVVPELAATIRHAMAS